jgi:hypothetical protein
MFLPFVSDRAFTQLMGGVMRDGDRGFRALTATAIGAVFLVLLFAGFWDDWLYMWFASAALIAGTVWIVLTERNHQKELREWEWRLGIRRNTK